MLKISARDNPKLKFARKVRDGRAANLIFVEGLRLSAEALRSAIEIVEVFLSESFKHPESLPFNQRTIKHLVAEKVFNSITDTKNSQGVALICRKPATARTDFEAHISKGKLSIIVFLNQINNPSNLGAILRVAEAVDAAGVIVSKNSADVFSPKSIRASMGAVFRLNLWTRADFDEVLAWSKQNNFIPTAADIKAEKSYTEVDWRRPRLLVFGSEAAGLTSNERHQIEESLIIPMENEVESLNLAVACGIILFEAKRQIQEIQTFVS